ncbi:hypothetical protein LTR70_009423 [Exophiala xenobiotica]|uniref:alpha-glucosidase n=1 Tax=Lithohypha guttulata TaxID=1690604 RepID=A0ABR0JXW4_9EURO|nr:hypothetical protein LTR24_009258 [Lithohypha guttulata]KAK5310520.1 hypothetical protein LTR70_009423 [Exophiala xenobiotica]
MTSWDSMKGANALSLTAGISLMHQYGHDIGGFEGPQPSPQLLLRWVQLVWTKRLKRGEEQYWFGDTLLVGGVYEPGASEAQVYLPRKAGDQFDHGYVNLNAPHQYLASGQWTTISSPWQDHIPVLAKVGGALPVGKSVQTRMSGDVDPACKTLEEDDYRGVEIFPPKASSYGTSFSGSWYEDDGLSLKPNISKFTIEYGSIEEKVEVSLSSRAGDTFIPPLKEVVVILPQADKRHVVSARGEGLTKLDADEAGRTRYHLPAPFAIPEQQLVNGYH